MADNKLDKWVMLRKTKLHNTLRDGPGECDIRLDDRNVLVRHDLSGRRVDVVPAAGASPGTTAARPARRCAGVAASRLGRHLWDTTDEPTERLSPANGDAQFSRPP